MTMILTIEGSAHTFTPIKTYRLTYNLPDSFGVASFEPKDYSGLGRIDRAGAELNSVRSNTLDAVRRASETAKATTNAHLFGWLDAVPTLQAQFERELVRINAVVGLRPVEIEFAAAGFGDVCRAYVYACLRDKETQPDFQPIYSEWLNSTVRISSSAYRYYHQDADWLINIVTHAYGRAGMIVRRGTDTDYVEDGAIGCPAEGYMKTLLEEVTALITA